MTKTLMLAALLALSAVALAPAASARDCVFGDNPSALLNVCTGAMTTESPVGLGNDGACLIGNFCPSPAFNQPTSGDTCVSVGSGGVSRPFEYGVCTSVSPE